MQLAFPQLEATFNALHRGRLLNALRIERVPGNWMCTAPFEVVSGVRQGVVARPFLFNFAIDDMMRRTVDQCPANIILAPQGCPLTDLEYANDVVIFAESTTKL
ncbi:hypothetical protein RB195_023199 [Necator americanus]|uniref:Reverse transcriptase domain-containing protein n=1 Tax=Necator americanus TaxID=51031 RepID=A0ABR1EKH8_NECAM